MILKIFAIVGVLSMALATFFAVYSWSWLQSIGDPAISAAGYEFHSAIGSYVVWSTFGILLVLGTLLNWKSQRAWPLWITFAYFTLFTVVQYVFLNESYFAFKKANGLWLGEFSIGPLIALLLVAIAAAVVTVDYFAVKKVYQFTYRSKESENLTQIAEEEY